MVMLAAILYGLMPMLAKFSYSEGVNVISVLFYRYFLAFIMLSIFLIIKKKKMAISKKHQRTLTETYMKNMMNFEKSA